MTCEKAGANTSLELSVSGESMSLTSLSVMVQVPLAQDVPLLVCNGSTSSTYDLCGSQEPESVSHLLSY